MRPREGGENTRRWHGRTWGVAAVLLVLVAVGCLAWWADEPPEVTASRFSSVSRSPSILGTATTAPVTPLTQQGDSPGVRNRVARPVRLNIPAIGVSTRLVRLGLQGNGAVQVPGNPDVAGWFRLGPPPGGVGSSVILGHVDSTAGPAVFANLGHLRFGQRVRVLRTDGSTVIFRVVKVVAYPNARFPAHKIYGRLHGRRLNLVTCGGAYDNSKGGYQSNVVVYTRQLKVIR